jgi:integrase
MNPAREVKTEKFSRSEGKTPAFETDQVQKVLDKIDTSNEVGLRDRALLGTLAYTFARIGAVVNLKVEDYFQTGKRSPPPEGPLYRYCKCGCDTQVYNPIAEVLSSRVTPELRHLQVSLGAQLSYRKAADLLRMLLPPVGGTTHTTTRARLITVGSASTKRFDRRSPNIENPISWPSR